MEALLTESRCETLVNAVIDKCFKSRIKRGRLGGVNDPSFFVVLGPAFRFGVHIVPPRQSGYPRRSERGGFRPLET